MEETGIRNQLIVGGEGLKGELEMRKRGNGWLWRRYPSVVSRVLSESSPQTGVVGSAYSLNFVNLVEGGNDGDAWHVALGQRLGSP